MLMARLEMLFEQHARLTQQQEEIEVQRARLEQLLQALKNQQTKLEQQQEEVFAL